MYFSPRLTVYFAASVALSSTASALSIERRDACTDFSDRTFRIWATSMLGTGFSETFQATIEHDFDPKRTLAIEVSGCTARTRGGGCKWQKSEESPLKSYKVLHGPFSPYLSGETLVSISGDGCDKQALECVGENSVTVVDPNDPTAMMYISTHKCAVERPSTASSPDDQDHIQALIQAWADAGAAASSDTGAETAPADSPQSPSTNPPGSGPRIN